MLLVKFHIQDNPAKFALYEQLTDKDQGTVIRYSSSYYGPRVTLLSSMRQRFI